MYFKYEKDTEGIVTLTMDQPGSSANLMGHEFDEGLGEVLRQLSQEKELTGVILASAKKTFMAGGDLSMLYALDDPKMTFDMVESTKAQLRRLETLGKPVVAAINGATLGGGYELALSCHHLIALDTPSVQIGLPEVTLGLLPGAGGVTRLTRRLGLQAAFPILTGEKRFKSQQALEAGVVDELATDVDDMMDKARAWIRANPEAQQPWDEKGFRFPGGGPGTPGFDQFAMVAPAMMNKKTRGNFPAPQAVLNIAVEGASVDFDTATRIESRYFADLAAGKVSKNMITAFWFQMNAVNGGQSRPDGYEVSKVAKVGVLGAGMMGAGIAYSAAVAGVDVVLKDVSKESAEKGKAYSDKILAKQVKRGRMAEKKKAAILARIHPTDSAPDLQGCELIIEAVFEDRGLKAKVTKEAEAQLAPEAVFGTNTSTLPITGLAEASARPENFIGLHFFSPVDKMNLVEIITGEKTSDKTLAKAFDFVKQIRKTPIVVSDSRGFYTSRVFSLYPKEATLLLAEGQNARAIESAGLQAGMPVAPLAISDEISLSLALDVGRQTRKDLVSEGKEPPHDPYYDVTVDMVEKYKRPGKAAGKGFYEYPKEGTKHLWPDLKTIYGNAKQALTQEEMIDRLLFVQALDTVRCLDEGVLHSVADANIGSILGWGFPPFKGGVLQYINDYGLPEFVVRAKDLAEKYGDRFTPPASLEEKAANGERYK